MTQLAVAEVATRADPLIETSEGDNPFRSSLDVSYPSEAWAKIVINALSVDSELQPEKMQRKIRVEGTHLHVTFETKDPKLLRAAVNAFMDVLILATRTLEKFGV